MIENHGFCSTMAPGRGLGGTNLVKLAQRGDKRSQDGPKEDPRRSKGGPREDQGGPKGVPRGSQGRQQLLKGGLRGAKWGPLGPNLRKKW